MKTIYQEIQSIVCQEINIKYGVKIPENLCQIQEIKPTFQGDITLLVFPLVSYLKQSASIIGGTLASGLLATYPQIIANCKCISGFLNISLHNLYLNKKLEQLFIDSFNNQNEKESRWQFKKVENKKKYCLEYSSPNTNKPLHLGHLRNNFLGMSLSKILECIGHIVYKTCIVNDRGIHICKSMVAWKYYGNNSTPESTHKKGDHFVGDYYVLYNQQLTNEVKLLINQGLSKEEAEQKAPIAQAAKEYLLKWEKNDSEIMEIWHNMNDWVYQGFKQTYKLIGSQFEAIYYESKIYKLGKELINKGLEDGVFYRNKAGAICIDINKDGLDTKIVQRQDGTAVYITQDIALAQLKFDDFNMDENIYIVGDEQNSHFKTLKYICAKLKIQGSENIQHLSYGMVELPTGKMKSREGTVVDADDLIADLKKLAIEQTQQINHSHSFSATELEKLGMTLGLGALKYYLLRVDPKNTIVFNPTESLDFKGNTATFVQYCYVRIKSLLIKNEFFENLDSFSITDLEELPEEWSKIERKIIVQLDQFSDRVIEAGTHFNPSKIVNFVYLLAQQFNNLYTEINFGRLANHLHRKRLLCLAFLVAVALKEGCQLLGIEMPEKM